MDTTSIMHKKFTQLFSPTHHPEKSRLIKVPPTKQKWETRKTFVPSDNSSRKNHFNAPFLPFLRVIQVFNLKALSC